jgi:hypothetical protein
LTKELRIYHKGFIKLRIMDLETIDMARIGIGAAILVYVANCTLNQRVWIRKTFSWGAKDEYPKIYLMNVIGGTMIGLFLISSPFLL